MQKRCLGFFNEATTHQCSQAPSERHTSGRQGFSVAADRRGWQRNPPSSCREAAGGRWETCRSARVWTRKALVGQ